MVEHTVSNWLKMMKSSARTFRTWVLRHQIWHWFTFTKGARFHRQCIWDRKPSKRIQSRCCIQVCLQMKRQALGVTYLQRSSCAVTMSLWQPLASGNIQVLRWGIFPQLWRGGATRSRWSLLSSKAQGPKPMILWDILDALGASIKFDNVDLGVWVTLPFQPCHFSFLGIPKSFGCGEEITIFLGQPSPEKSLKLPAVLWRRIFAGILAEAVKTSSYRFAVGDRLLELFLFLPNTFSLAMLCSSSSKTLDFALALHILKKEDLQFDTATNCLFDVGRPQRPPSATPWFLFSI